MEALTRHPGEDYVAVVAPQAAKDPIARVVKAADVADDGGEGRLALLPLALLTGFGPGTKHEVLAEREAP